jgi:hypothetical protein
LKNNKSYEIDTLARCVKVCEFILGIAVKAIAIVFEGEYEGMEWDTGVAIHVEEEHSVSANGFHHTVKEI